MTSVWSLTRLPTAGERSAVVTGTFTWSSKSVDLDGGPDESGLGQDALDRRDHRWGASGKSEDILHVVDPGLLRHDPLGGPERAVRKHGPVACAVGELEAFARAGEDDRVVPHDIAPAQRMDADLGGRARAGDPLAAVAKRRPVEPALLHDDLEKPGGRAARGVLS